MRNMKRMKMQHGKLFFRVAAGLFSALCLIPLLGARVAGPVPQPAHTTAFTHVTVLAMDRQRSLEDQTVIVQGRIISAVGPAGSVEVPAGARRIDGRGLFLLPGLADMHIHLFNPKDRLLYLANGVTTVRNLGGEAGDILKEREEVRSGKLIGPTIYTSGNWLDGDPPARPINTVVHNPEEARRIVDDEKKAGFDFVKVYANLRPDVYQAILQEAKKVGIPVTGHVPRPVGLMKVIEGGQVAIDHAGQFVPYFGRDLDPSRILPVALKTRRAGVSVTTTLSMFEEVIAMRGNPGEIRRLLSLPRAQYLSPGIKHFWRDQNPFLNLPPSRLLEDRFHFAERLTAELQKAGVRLLLGTDSGLWGNYPGYSTHRELRLLVKAGLTPWQALRAGTANADSFLRDTVPGSDRTGIIAPGRQADLLLVSANPLQDVANLRRIKGVMARGRWFSEERLQELLKQLADGYRKSASN